MPSGVILMLAGFRSRCDDALLVRRIERVGDLTRDRQRLVDREWSPARCARRACRPRRARARARGRRRCPPRRRWRRCADDSGPPAAALRGRSGRAGRDRSLKTRGRILIATSRPSVRVAGPVDLAHAARRRAARESCTARPAARRTTVPPPGIPSASAGVLSKPAATRGVRDQRLDVPPQRLVVCHRPRAGTPPAHAAARSSAAPRRRSTMVHRSSFTGSSFACAASDRGAPRRPRGSARRAPSPTRG